MTENNQTPPAQPLKSFLGNTAQAPIARNLNDDELLLDSPSKYREKVISDVRHEMATYDAQKRARETLFNEFYQENPDLKDVDWHVQSVLGEKVVEWKDLSIPDAKKKLAEESRRRIDLLRSKTGVKKEELSSTTASALPSSGDPSPFNMESNAPKSATNFVQEITEWRNKRKRQR